MQLSAAVLAVLTALAAPILADTVSFDTVYDDPSVSLDEVACSDGPNGLLTKGFTTFGSLPTFPNIGAAQAIAGWNSAACGSCWKISYKGKSITVTAVDHAGDGFNLAETALNTLTNGQAVALGEISATAVEVDASECGITA